MALIQRAPSRKKQIQLGLTLTAIIGVTLAVAYFGLIRKPSYETPQGGVSIPGVGDTEQKGLKSSGIDALQELQSIPEYSELEIYGRFPIQTSPRGKQEPFLSPKE